MNTNILKKCVEELRKDDFKKDYVLGMLETIIEISEINHKPPVNIINNQTTPYKIDETTPEPVPDFLKPGPVGKIES